MFVSELFYRHILFTIAALNLFFSIVLPLVANEDAEGSTRPQANFARKYQGTT